MSIIASENKAQSIQTPYYKRTIRCPGHYLVPPQVDIYLREPVSLFKNCSDFVEFKGKRMKIKKTRIAKDKWGNKKVDWKKLEELRKAGIVLQPRVSAAWAIENIYDPLSLLCLRCPKYCKEGQGRVITTTINRLMGKSSKER